MNIDTNKIHEKNMRINIKGQLINFCFEISK
jgi:hypothetical protein